MKTITINGKDLKLEFTYEAAECKELIQKMFGVVSGAYILKNGNKGKVAAIYDGAAEMVGEIPLICKTAFYAGLLENNPATEDEAKELMKAYMKENKLSYAGLYKEIKQCMEDDGFFELSGLNEMLRDMNEEAVAQAEQNQPKTPQDHQKKSTSIK